MSLNKLVAKQYRDKVNQAVDQLASFSMLPNRGLPREGWLRTVRKALGMSGVQLARRLRVTKARVSKAEQDEPNGRVTLKTMETMAEAMNCIFIYAVVPKQHVEDLIKEQATRKAYTEVRQAMTHMALEAQSLNEEQTRYEVERIAAELMEKMPSDFWSDP